MLNQSVRIPRWRAVVLCLAGVLAMIKPLQTGVGIYRSSLPAPLQNYSRLYGWVEHAGPFNENELRRAEERVRLLAYPRASFAREEIERTAADVRAAAWADIRREHLLARQHSHTAWTDRAVGLTMTLIGAGGIAFYLWLGHALLRESDAHPKDPHTGWFGRKKRHGRIRFGSAFAQEPC